MTALHGTNQEGQNEQYWGIGVFLDCLIEGLQQQFLIALPSHSKDGNAKLNERLFSQSSPSAEDDFKMTALFNE